MSTSFMAPSKEMQTKMHATPLELLKTAMAFSLIVWRMTVDPGVA